MLKKTNLLMIVGMQSKVKSRRLNTGEKQKLSKISSFYPPHYPPLSQSMRQTKSAKAL
jgi:hypothetical protein